MREAWTGEAVAKMHIWEIQRCEVAAAAGISNTYLSSLLTGERKAPGAEKRIMEALDSIIERKQGGF